MMIVLPAHHRNTSNKLLPIIDSNVRESLPIGCVDSIIVSIPPPTHVHCTKLSKECMMVTS